MPKPNTEEWLCEMIRATLFLTDSQTLQKPGLWNTLVGTEPEALNAKPQAGEYSEAGVVDGDKALEVRASLNRIDLLIGRPIHLVEAFSTLPNIGTLQAAVAILRGYVDRCLRATGLVTVRVAFGAVVQLPAVDRAASYATLATVVPSLGFDVQRVSDFQLQMNLSRPSKSVPGLDLNRVCKWSAVQAEISAGQVGAQTTTKASHHFARIELDFSSQASRREPFSAEQAVLVFEELFDDGRLVLDRGSQWLF